MPIACTALSESQSHLSCLSAMQQGSENQMPSQDTITSLSTPAQLRPRVCASLEAAMKAFQQHQSHHEVDAHASPGLLLFAVQSAILVTGMS